MTRVLARLAAPVAVVALLALWATPVSAGTVQGLTVGGRATCNVPTGHETYTLDWTVTAGSPPGAVQNQPALPIGPQIISAVESGAFTGTVTFTPNPVGWNTTSSGTDGPVPNVAGTVTLTVTYTELNGPQVTATGTIVLDGLCRLPVTTTTAPVAVAATQPSFTG